MKSVKKTCLSCKSFRLDDINSGVCRVEKRSDGIYPLKLHEDICELWTDCGQQYYIRKGWLRARTEAAEKADD